MKEFKFEKQKKTPNDPKIDNHDLPLQEIGSEKNIYEINIINGVLEDFDKRREEIETERDGRKNIQKPN
ncbi:MAG: hypothetical protein HY226_02640 [Candidatus Vogelbacteria bacterium]|nr:hypothetical protein [Candidatus Vogelbacteria bacterium]